MFLTWYLEMKGVELLLKLEQPYLLRQNVGIKDYFYIQSYVFFTTIHFLCRFWCMSGFRPGDSILVCTRCFQLNMTFFLSLTPRLETHICSICCTIFKVSHHLGTCIKGLNQWCQSESARTNVSIIYKPVSWFPTDRSLYGGNIGR